MKMTLKMGVFHHTVKGPPGLSGPLPTHMSTQTHRHTHHVTHTRAHTPPFPWSAAPLTPGPAWLAERRPQRTSGRGMEALPPML